MRRLSALWRQLGREPSRTEIAAALDVHPSTISRRLAGDEGFHLEEMMRMCTYFNLSRCRMLLDLGWLTQDDVSHVTQMLASPIKEMSDLQLLDELASRALARSGTDVRPGSNRGGKRRGRGIFN